MNNASSLCVSLMFASDFAQQTRKVNIHVTTLIIIMGLLGNSCGFFVLLQKKVRSKSTSVYLICLNFCDNIYLMLHFFEDTLKAYIDHYIYKESFLTQEYQLACLIANTTSTAVELSVDQNNLVILINVMDRYDTICRSINFARYFVRFMSAYILVVFTMQRTRVIMAPFSRAKFESKRKLAWMIGVLTTLGILSTAWIPMMLKSDQTSDRSECFIREGLSSVYFALTNAYIFVVILVPIVIICVCNAVSIYSLQKSSHTIKSLSSTSLAASRVNTALTRSHAMCKNNFEQLSFELLPNNKQPVRFKLTINKEKKTHVMLLVMSFSFVILDLPYFVSWLLLFYYNTYFDMADEAIEHRMSFSATQCFLVAVINLTEIFYLMNYSIHFYIYCISSKTFRTRLQRAFQCKN